MNLNNKVTVLFSAIAAALLAVLIAISLYAFRSFSIASATEHLLTSAEIVRVHLTESMINGVIDKRERFLQRLTEVHGLRSARVVRSADVSKQFGQGLNLETAADDIERSVLAEGKPRFELVTDKGEAIYRGTVPYIATVSGNPNCLQCHQVREGTVLGAVTMTLSIDDLKQKALLTVAGIAGAVTLFSALLILLARRLLRPISDTAHAVEEAVHRALEGDFKAHVRQQTKDEIGQIANDMNRLLGFLDDGLNRIGTNVARLTQRTPSADENLLTATIDMVDSLTRAAHFKQAIEEDETKAEIYQRLAVTLENQFGIKEYSLYEIGQGTNHIRPIIVDGTLSADCRWCDPQILTRPEACRARRTGHTTDGVVSPAICYAFQPPAEAGDRQHICLPVIQSGSVGSVVQLVAKPEAASELCRVLPYIKVYLRDTAPVLETKRLMETLREANLHDPMTGLSNRRFLEEFIATLLASVQRRHTHLAVLMLDLDYFKMVNDTYGHDAGDAVLKAVSKVFTQSVRASDLVIRYGGEEFLIILQDAAAEAAERVAENIRVAVENLKVQTAGTLLQKTISIGIADFPTDSETFWQAVKFADVALYQAKETGRNRVVRFKPEMWHDKSEY
ncbi:MAG: putative diguanylate cyclase domain [Rhodocyclaceae bacterium]|nr:putative diguanylate cyclase domain [Rhodocyclaceae bacterium]